MLFYAQRNWHVELYAKFVMVDAGKWLFCKIIEKGNGKGIYV